MAWMALLLAGVFEIVWAYSMKLSDGFTRLTPSIVTLIFMMLSFPIHECFKCVYQFRIKKNLNLYLN